MTPLTGEKSREGLGVSLKWKGCMAAGGLEQQTAVTTSKAKVITASTETRTHPHSGWSLPAWLFLDLTPASAKF